MFVWLAAVVVFFVIEAAVPGLISLWFGIAAVLTMIASVFVKDVFHQLYIFIILSGVIFVITKNISKSFREKKLKNIDRIRGRVVEIKDVKPDGEYEIYLDGKHWTGKSDDVFLKGEKAEVAEIEGIKLVLKKTDRN